MMKLVYLCWLCLGVQVKAFDYSLVIFEEFKLFQLQYGKTYANRTEEEFRMKIYIENRELIALHNQLYYKGIVTYTMAMNQFGDMLSSEYVDRLNSYVNTSSSIGLTLLNPSNVSIPKTLDYRTKGFVTPVKNQGDCNADYAFSAIGALEGQQFKKAHKLVALSAQNVIDCSGDHGNRGCSGGTVVNTYDSIIDLKGIEGEETYPFTGKEGKCNYDPDKAASSINTFGAFKPLNEYNLQCNVAAYGPTSVYIDAAHDSFRFYSQGVHYDEECSTTDLNLAVLAVGYDTDAKGGDYWIVKNSWGEGWGDKGYIKMARNKKNNCGIASAPSVPIPPPPAENIF